MAETTALMTQAEQVLNAAYADFKRAQLQYSPVALFENAAEIFMVTQITTATLLYLFDDSIAQRVLTLGDNVLTTMYTQAKQTEFLKINFTGNDVRWLLGLPRTHRRQR
ncbi:hypothetical protein C5Z25_06205 [Lactobacillus sp. CBA3605]|uniref:hypothetical protein n=1 Tax=Lactobacillus sp. CBA3605 TaxID=2099788 RepID=UPI000CFBA5BD|nr:hypothetical protein [Lactobacillus sp. CBA3605]AVK61385.1 hypothetical protein C5Z25_06205 [Lactobacillus sp. CBA3605]